MHGKQTYEVLYTSGVEFLKYKSRVLFVYFAEHFCYNVQHAFPHQTVQPFTVKVLNIINIDLPNNGFVSATVGRMFSLAERDTNRANGTSQRQRVKYEIT